MGARRFAILAILWCLGGFSRAWAQGSPPMLTDDPGTPGNGHWELNFGWITQRTPGSSLWDAPDADLNYGIGDRGQITYQTDYVVARDQQGDRGGIGDSQVAFKWRFLDPGNQGWSASVFPRVLFLDPGSDSDRRELANGDTTFFLPMEAMKNLGNFALDFDAGHTFGPKSSDAGWTGGVEIAYHFSEKWELDAEVRVDGPSRLDRTELIENFGVQIELASDSTLLASVGRDFHNSYTPHVSLLSYLGVQFRL